MIFSQLHLCRISPGRSGVRICKCFDFYAFAVTVRWLTAVMKIKRLILTCVIFNAAIAGIVWVAIFGWPSIIIRNKEYRELIRNFQQAQPREKKSGDENVLWDFQFHLSNGQTTIRVWAPAYPGVVWLKDIDGKADHPLYKYVDYSHPVEIRTTENVLYVYWAESLLRTDHWLIAYDLVNRREIVRRKIDPDDLAQSH
jgi:hypothetical protein